MTSVHQLDPNIEAKRHVVDELREQLRRAEAGEYRSVHICAFRIDDGAMVRVSAGEWVTFEVVAALECAKHGIIAKNVRPDEPVI